MIRTDFEPAELDAMASELDAMASEVDAALASLKAKGHPISCQCKLCFSGRRLRSVLKRIAQPLEDDSNGRAESVSVAGKEAGV